MRAAAFLLASLSLVACNRKPDTVSVSDLAAHPELISSVTVHDANKPATPPIGLVNKSEYLGFDRNEYPGDTIMAALHHSFAFTGYWLTVPPGAMFNQWQGKRPLLRDQGWGFLVLANGKLEKEILAAKITPDALGQRDAAAAIAAAKSEGFPPRTILFLDQEEGGRLTTPQAGYLLAWVSAVATSDYDPGVYASGQRTSDDPGTFITTIDDIRQRIAASMAGNNPVVTASSANPSAARANQDKLRNLAIFDAQDTCPPAPGCTLAAKPLSSAGEPNLTAWQYSQTPRRPSLTVSCAATYAPDNRCYAPSFPTVFLDNDVATSPDPSHGR